MKTALISATLLAMTLGTASLPNQGRVYGFFAWPGLARRGALAAHPLPIAGQPLQTAGAITGTVLGDDGHPLIGATVSVTRRAGKGEVGSHLAAQTDGTGVFKILSLPEGEYEISVSARGYLREYAMDSAQQNRVPRTIHPGETVSIVLKKGGVITGRVMTEDGEPAIEAPVSAEAYRDSYGRVLRGPSVYEVEQVLTDDRGIYRIYGLPEGGYLVKVGKAWRFPRTRSSYEKNVPIYYPSEPRTAAEEVSVRPGQEVAGIDIRYKIIRGFSVTGVVNDENKVTPFLQSMVSLVATSSRMRADFAYCTFNDGGCRFRFDGIPEGEYELVAEKQMTESDEGGRSASLPVRIVDADVSGVVLSIASLGSVSGRLVIEPRTPHVSGGCGSEVQSMLSQASIWIVPDWLAQWPPDQRFPGAPANPGGEFIIHRVPAGRYFFTAQLPRDFYLKSVSVPGATDRSRPVNVGRSGLRLKQGQRAISLLVIAGDGASSLSGHVVPASPKSALPQDIVVIAVPQEIDFADDVLRFAEIPVRERGVYSFGNLAPGRYRLVTRISPHTDSADSRFPRMIWNAAERTKLRREATASGAEVELQPCEHKTAPVLIFAVAQEER